MRWPAYIPKTFTQRVLRDIAPIRNALKWSRGAIHYYHHDPADSLRGQVPEPPYEPRHEREHAIDYPAMPDQYELPAPEAWFEDFHVRPTPGPSWIPDTQPLTASMDGGLNPVDQPAIEQPDLYPPEGTQPEDYAGMLEVRWAVEHVQTGELSPACLPDVAQPHDVPDGPGGQFGPPHAYHPAGLESMLNQPPDVLPEQFVPNLPEPPF